MNFEADECVVVISLYNKQSVIARAVKSVISQTHSRWVMVIVDDGSTDGSASRIKPFLNDERVRYVYQDNRGPGAARNRGLQEVNAPFCAFLDADDEWEPEFLEEMLRELDKRRATALVACSWQYGEAAVDSRVKRRLGGVLEGPWSLTADTNINFTTMKARIDSIHSSAVVARRAAILKAGGYYENGSTYGEDSYLWGRLLFSGAEITTSDKILLKFHTDASSLSHGRRSAYPLPPMLASSDSFVAGLSKSQAALARVYLARYSAYVARRAVSQRSIAVFCCAVAKTAILSFYSILTSRAGGSNG